jgi:hypothetical protein
MMHRNRSIYWTVTYGAVMRLRGLMAMGFNVNRRRSEISASPAPRRRIEREQPVSARGFLAPLDGLGDGAEIRGKAE